jgi:Zn ribbon nucleic-acid-binding protein
MQLDFSGLVCFVILPSCTFLFFLIMDITRCKKRKIRFYDMKCPKCNAEGLIHKQWETYYTKHVKCTKCEYHVYWNK